MTENEQIQEMARIIGCCKSYLHPVIKCHSEEYGCHCAENPCYNELVASRLYSKGYRKASEVAKEVIADIRQSLINMVLLNITGEEYDLAKAIADVEKKYTEGEK